MRQLAGVGPHLHPGSGGCGVGGGGSPATSTSATGVTGMLTQHRLSNKFDATAPCLCSHRGHHQQHQPHHLLLTRHNRSFAVASAQQHLQNHLGSNHVSQRELMKHQCQLTRMLLGYCIAYVACNFPNYLLLIFGYAAFHRINFESRLTYMTFNAARVGALWFYYLHFATNSLIYAYANRHFRLAFRNLCRRVAFCWRRS